MDSIDFQVSRAEWEVLKNVFKSFKKNTIMEYTPKDSEFLWSPKLPQEENENSSPTKPYISGTSRTVDIPERVVKNGSGKMSATKVWMFVREIPGAGHIIGA